MYHKSRSYVWFRRYNAQRTEFFCHFGSFLPFDLPNNLKHQNFEKIKTKKKTPGDVITLHLCTTNDDHMMYGYWDMKSTRQNFLTFRASFCPFTPLTAWKMKISKKWKKILEISSFHTSVPKIMIIRYTVPEIWRVTDVLAIFHFGLYLSILPP